MHIGELDQQIDLYSVTETNVGGEMTQTLKKIATVWAKVISQRGNEAFESARTNARDTIRVMIHFRDDVTNKWRIVWNQESYNVVNTDRSMRRHGELWFTAEAVGAL